MLTLDDRWVVWARHLQRWGLSQPAAVLLEAGGPITILAAQFVYLGQPLLNSFLPTDQWRAAGEMLENPQACRSFAAFLREEDHR